MKYTYIFSLFVIVLLFTSCEEQLVTIPEFTPPKSDRVVLIEEMTGASCPNCPKGTAELENIASQYGKLVVPVAIHGNFLANPTAESKFDFRSDDSNALEELLGPHFGKPCATFNRGKYGGNYLTSKNVDSWSSFVKAELEKEHVLNVQLATEYDADSRTVNIIVTFIPLKDLGSNNRITVMVLENDIEDAQETTANIVEQKFEHVLRDIITEVGGTPITEELKKDQIYKYTYSYTIPQDDKNWWIPEHMEIVAFCNRQDSDSFEVLQAAKAKITE